MDKKRVTITVQVEVDLDPIPGTFHQPEDWVVWLTQRIETLADHYNLKVTKAKFKEAAIE